MWLRQLHESVHVTTVLVTHDQEEAMEVSDQIVVMNKGRVEQIGTPSEIYDEPATPFVMSFVGLVNVLPSNSGILPDKGLVTPTTDRIFLRPHDVVIQIHPDDDATPAKVYRIINLGWEIRVELVLKSGEQLNAYLSRDQFNQLDIKEQQRVYFKSRQAKIFPAYALS